LSDPARRALSPRPNSDIVQRILAITPFQPKEDRMPIKTLRRRLARTAGLALVATALFTTVQPRTPAFARDGFVTLQGDPDERATRREQLFDALAAATDEAAARQAADRIWLFWFEAPDKQAEELMREAQDRRSMHDFVPALALLDQLVKDAPDWAEAWNQRATIRFLVGDYTGSLADIDRVLALEPKHFGALSGEALILQRLGREEEAQAVLRKAVKINPFLVERALLKEPEGQNI
jgi:tetratricopeptide (TPR) repeat protein